MEETDGPVDFYDTDTVRKFSLTEEALAEKNAILRSNDNEMAEQQKAQILDNTVRHWDLFYKRNTDHFFKDRAWLSKELPEIAEACRAAEKSGSDESLFLIDVGCGVGNALFPILLANPRIKATAFDCSPRAIAILRERWTAILSEQREGQSDAEPHSIVHPSKSVSASQPFIFLGTVRSRTPSTAPSQSRSDRKAPDSMQKPAAAAAAEAVAKGVAQIFHYPYGQLCTLAAFDITAGDVPREIAAKGSGSFVLLIFVLSALHPRHHSAVAKRCAELLKPGGMVLFRDYGRFDLAHMRFAKQRKPKIEQNLYARYDGTLAYYFLKEELEELFCRSAGLEVVENRYCMREMLNRKTRQRMQRIWIQAKFRRSLG